VGWRKGSKWCLPHNVEWVNAILISMKVGEVRWAIVHQDGEYLFLEYTLRQIE